MKFLKRLKRDACCICCCRYVLVLRSMEETDPFCRGEWVIVDRQEMRIVQRLVDCGSRDAEYVLKLYKKYGE